MSTFDVLYKRLTKTLVELRDKHGMDPERIALQAAKSAERSNRTAGRRSVSRSMGRSVGRRNRAGGKTYRGILINKVESIQVGYRTHEGKTPGKGKKIAGYEFTIDGYKKFVDTLSQAKAYIDSYLG